MKAENHTVISTDAEKAPDKIQHLCMIKKHSHQTGTEGQYHNLSARYDKPTANIILRPRALPLISGTRHGCPLSPDLFTIIRNF